MLSPLKPIAIKERNSIAFLSYGELDVIDGAFMLVDKEGVRKHIPVGGCLSDAGAGDVGTGSRGGNIADKHRVGESGVRLYAAGQPGGAVQIDCSIV